MNNNASLNKKPFHKLPIFSLILLSASCFVVILTETMPAGLLLPISRELGITEAMTGQWVTAYALGSLLAAIPLSMATSRYRRRPILMLSILVFAVANLITALSSHYYSILIVRFIAGMSAGLLWSIVAGYATRIVAPEFKGRAIAISMAGTPLALSLGLPASAFLGQILGWRNVFLLMSGLSVLLIVLIQFNMPDVSGQSAGQRKSLIKVLSIPGMASILIALFTFVLAHNILYTYIGPISIPSGMDKELGTVLLAFGLSSLLGIAFIGKYVDRILRKLTLLSIILFLAATLLIAFYNQNPAILIASAIIWGLGYGGSATLFQTATVHTAAENVDVAQASTVVAWNLSISGGGIIGGLLLGTNISMLAYVASLLLIITLIVVWLASKHGFNN